MTDATGPLAGIRVVEFGQLLAGPYVGTLLGDFGADVIKVEPPGGGDAMRDWGRLRHNGHSLWWSILGRNKRSVSLNLRTPEGQSIARRLVQDADVVVFLYRDEYYKTAEAAGAAEQSANTAEIIIAKNRHGGTGTVRVGWIGQYTKFRTIEEGLE